MKPQQEPKIKKGDRTRQRILETASALMAESGPDAVSMREISAKLKITKPVLYYYFKNKDELIKASFVEGTKHFDELLAEIQDPALTLEQKVERVFANHLEFIRRYPDMPKCALKIMTSPSASVLSGMARELKQRNRAAMRAMMEASAGKDRLSKAGIEGILHMISAVIGYFMIEARENGVASLDKGLPGRLSKLLCAGARSLKALAAGLALSALLAAGAAAAPLDLTVDAAVGAALRNNATVLNAESARAIYKEKVNEYWGTVYPQLSASAQWTNYLSRPAAALLGPKTDNVYAGSLDLNQVLWSGGKVATAIRMARIYSEASDEQYKAARAGITKGVRQLYYSVLLARALAEIQQEALDLARQHLGTIEAQYKQGVASDLAVLRQQVEVSNTEPALTKARNLYEVGLTELKNLLGLDPEAEVSLSGGLDCAPAIPADAAGLYKKALAARPEYKNQKQQLELAEKMIKIERAAHLPYLGAYASRQYYGATDDSFPASGEYTWSTVAGLRLSVPLFAGGSVSAKVAQAKYQADISRNNLAELERRIKIDVKKAWLGGREAAERLASQATSVAQARKALAATETRFKNGLSSQLDLNDATLALNRSQTLYTQARHDVCSAEAELNWAVGD
ncbi:MAG: TolC family protein [Elusimicrobiales bacterium]|nr:TolC family protein [Elusimicrobiales bacterium]